MPWGVVKIWDVEVITRGGMPMIGTRHLRRSDDTPLAILMIIQGERVAGTMIELVPRMIDIIHKGEQVVDTMIGRGPRMIDIIRNMKTSITMNRAEGEVAHHTTCQTYTMDLCYLWAFLSS